MTSNIGAQLILDAKNLDSQVESQINNLLYKIFKPEFLNRIDAIVYFKQLSKIDVQKIAELQLIELKTRLLAQSIELDINPAVITKISELGFSQEFGARPLKRAIQQYIIVPLSQAILKNPEHQKLIVQVVDDKITVN